MSRLQRLRIENFRGIRTLDLNLRGMNCVIYGPNGSGKSSVADAIDFLLTGDLRRLGGEGALGLSIGKHGRHVDVGAEHSCVEATFDSPGSETGVVTLRRVIARPENLQIDGVIPSDLHALMATARAGSQHMLTRREVLKYIFTPPARRMEQVSALLRLTKIDTMRIELQAAARDAEQAFQRACDLSNARKESALKAVSPAAKDGPDLLARIAAHRVTLGAPPLPTKDTPVRQGVTPPLEASAHPLQGAQIKAQVEELRRWVNGADAAVTAVRAYVTDAKRIQDDESALKAFKAATLIAQGLELATGDECPLCERDWENAELREYLRKRLLASEGAQQAQRALETRRTELQRRFTTRVTSMRSLAESLRATIPAVAESLDSYFARVEEVGTTLLVDPVHQKAPDDADTTLESLADLEAASALALLDATAAGLPKLSGAQQAWDELSAIERTVAEHATARKHEKRAKRVANQLSIASEQFVASRDATLEQTYGAIATEFTTLYRALHGEDESAFTAELSPTKAGLKLEVDFYGRGSHPPTALHSEGHQDSMGVCLFLVLAEHLGAGAMPLIVLDDVLMSVDKGHRRKVADLLGERFPEVQFVITTHDEVWYRQLQTAGVVKSQQCVEMRDWSIDAGPQVVGEAWTLLAKAEEALNGGDVRRSAHLLRTAVETHFRDICDSLGAELRYRADSTYGAGDFTMGASSRLKEVVKAAKNAAASWGHDVSAIDTYDKRRVTTSTGLTGESWAVNPNIHYNDWAHMEKPDFRPVLEAHKALFALYICDICETPYRVVYEGVKETAFRCKCGHVNWTLQKA